MKIHVVDGNFLKWVNMKLLWNTKAFVYDYKIKHVAWDGIAKSANIHTSIVILSNTEHTCTTSTRPTITSIYGCGSQVHVRTERAEIVETIQNSVNKNDGVKNKAKYYFSLLWHIAEKKLWKSIRKWSKCHL